MTSGWDGLIVFAWLGVSGVIFLWLRRKDSRAHGQARADMARWSQAELTGRAHAIVLILRRELDDRGLERVPVARLASELKWDRDQVMAIVAGLETEGIIQSTKNGDSAVSLTQAGHDFTDRLLFPSHEDAVLVWLGALSGISYNLHAVVRLALSVLLASPEATVVTRDKSLRWLSEHCVRLLRLRARHGKGKDTDEELIALLTKACDIEDRRHRLTEQIGISSLTRLQFGTILAEPRFEEIERIATDIEELCGQLNDRLQVDYPDQTLLCLSQMRRYDLDTREESHLARPKP